MFSCLLLCCLWFRQISPLAGSNRLAGSEILSLEALFFRRNFCFFQQKYRFQRRISAPAARFGRRKNPDDFRQSMRACVIVFASSQSLWLATGWREERRKHGKNKKKLMV